MLHTNKMIYQPPKYHSFSHFLRLTSSNSSNNSVVRGLNDDSQHEINDQNSNDASNTSIEVANESVGKSFTIAAILGLKKGNGNATHDDTDYNNQDFPNIINLATHSKLFHEPQLPIDNCIYDNNTASSSSVAYQEHLHKHQHQLNGIEFNNYNNINNNNINSERSHQHNHHHIHSSANLINKAFNRERNRIGELILMMI